jgi:ketosteroid isomerase-like protein
MIINLNLGGLFGEGSVSRFCSARVIVAAVALVSSPLGGTRASAQNVGGDTAAVAAVVERYHRALESGDSVAALGLLTSDAVILESGGIETREEYRSHHLPADIEFARAVKSVRSPIRVMVRGDVAWATSTSTAQGDFRGRPVNSAGAELMVLTRATDGWKINVIHWSSRSRRS